MCSTKGGPPAQKGKPRYTVVKSFVKTTPGARTKGADRKQVDDWVKKIKEMLTAEGAGDLALEIQEVEVKGIHPFRFNMWSPRASELTAAIRELIFSDIDAGITQLALKGKRPMVTDEPTEEEESWNGGVGAVMGGTRSCLTTSACPEPMAKCHWQLRTVYAKAPSGKDCNVASSMRRPSSIGTTKACGAWG